MDGSAGPDDWSAWPFAAITVSRSNRRGHMHGLPGLSKGSHHFVGALDLSLAKNSSCRALRGRQAEIGRSSYWPPRVISTKTMRATLLATATAVSLNLYLTVLRSSSALAHRRKASLCPLRWRRVAQAPTTRSLRR